MGGCCGFLKMGISRKLMAGFGKGGTILLTGGDTSFFIEYPTAGVAVFAESFASTPFKKDMEANITIMNL